MHKNNSRLKKIEEVLNVEDIEPVFIVIMGWDEPNCRKYFINDEEIEKYKEWRMNTIKLEYRQKGTPVPVMSFCFDEQDVEEHIDEYHRIAGSLTVHGQIKCVELPEEIVIKNDLDMTNSGGKLKNQI